MSRKFVSATHINNWLTTELQKTPDCEQCTLSGVMKLQDIDDDGCNWTERAVVLNAAGANDPYVVKKAQDLVLLAKSLFNIE
jgi:hypothetical protein